MKLTDMKHMVNEEEQRPKYDAADKLDIILAMLTSISKIADSYYEEAEFGDNDRSAALYEGQSIMAADILKKVKRVIDK